MRNFAMKAFLGILAAGAAMPAFAADPYEPAPEPAPVIEAPVAVAEPVETGGWYIRGDLGYRFKTDVDAEYITYGPTTGPIEPGTDFLEGELKGAMSVGGGIGYQINDYFRTDLTADYWFDSDFNGSSGGGVTTDTSSMSALLLLANAYVDLGTYGGFTPYIGAGIGGAHLKWDTLTNTPPGVEHPGAEGWRFAVAAMAGASYCLTDRVKLDGGYRFTRIEGGRMFEQVGTEPGPGFDDGLNVHEVRAGLRYSLGGSSSGCAAPEPVAYEPAPIAEPVYK